MTEMTNKQKAEVIGIKVFNLPNNKEKKYTLLPIRDWNVEICEEINKSSFNKEFYFDKEPLLPDRTEELKDKFSEVEKIRQIGKPIEKIFIWNELPIDFVRFNGMIILKAHRKEIITNCRNSIIENLDLIYKFYPIKSDLLHDEKFRKRIEKYSDVKKDLEDLKNICAVSALFSTNKIVDSENYVWNELLQNANDHICSQGKMNIKVASNSLTLEYPEEKGFTVRDFVAISTDGNSANVLMDTNTEGRKGTGFKSVYNLFKKVEIESGPVRCELKDIPVEIDLYQDEKEGQKVDIKEKSDVEKENKKGNEEKWHYPIPEFSEIEGFNTDERMTKIKFTFKDISIKDTILKKMFGEGNEGKTYKDRFEEKKDYLFLNNIKSFSFSVDGVSFEVDREEIIDNHFVKFSKKLFLSNEEETLKFNPYWEERKDKVSFEKKKEVTLLFPKNLNIEENDKERTIYCTLPVEEFKIKVPFYLNIPLLELEDNRKNISDKETNEGNLQGWNTRILSLVFEENGPVYSVFDEFSKAEETINRDNLYKYFPYSYLSKEEHIWKKIEIINYINTYTFIRTICWKNNEEVISCKCINDMVREEDIDKKEEESKFIFLPDYMNWWFKRKKGLEGFQSEIPFVFYDDISSGAENFKGAVKEIEEKIFRTDKKIIANFFSYKREGAGKVGKILLEIKNYLYKKGNEYHGKDVDRRDFKEWLREIKNSEFFDFKYREEFLIKALLYSLEQYSEEIVYHCFGNIDLKDGEFYDEKIALGDGKEYQSIKPLVNEIRDTFFDENQAFGEDENRAIKIAIGNVKNSPFFDMNLSYSNDNTLYKAELILYKNPGVLSLTSELLCKCTRELYNFCENEVWVYKDISVIMEWVEKGNILYWDKSGINKTPIPLTKNTYFSNQEISNLKVVCVSGKEEEWINKSIGIKRLEDEINKPDFFTKVDLELIREVVKKYEHNVSNGIKSYLEIDTDILLDSEKEKNAYLLKTYIGWINFKSYNLQSLQWKNKFRGIISMLEEEVLNGNNNFPLFKFESDSDLKQISKSLKERFAIRAGKQEKEALVKIEDSKNISLQKLIEEGVYILDCKIGNQRKYCWGELDNKKIIVLFNEKSLGTFLKLLGCTTFSEEKNYEDMTSGPLDNLVGFRNKELSDGDIAKVKGKAGEIYEYCQNDENSLLDNLIERCDIKLENGWINTEGYGKENYEEKRCPLCNSILFAEKSLLKLGYLTYRKENDNYHLPIPMCKNCMESMQYTNDIFLELQEGEIPSLNDAEMKEIGVFFDMYAGEKKNIKAKVSFLNRHIWNYILNKEE